VKHLRSLLPTELECVVLNHGFPSYRANQVFAWCAKGVREWDGMRNVPKQLRSILSEQYTLTKYEILKKLVSERDGTIKYLSALEDGSAVECVVMSYEHANSVCVSTQVGCRMGCRFCASAEGGLVRNLEAGEMLDQVLLVQEDTAQRVGSVVLMGIGEPLDNYDNTLRFLQLICHPLGLNLSPRHISLSTCGLVPRIDKMSEEGLPITLSISLHAPEDDLRRNLMPGAASHSVADVVDAGKRYSKRTGRKVYFEYVLLKGLNDGIDHAKQLGLLLKGALCHVNLMHYNQVQGSDFRPSSRDTADRFGSVLLEYGVTSTVRRRLGADIDAACGQLRSVL